MSFEINPVLAGKFDAPDYAPANNLAQTTSTADVSGPDPRLYTHFDHSATEAGSTTNFSFSDLLDTLNPLEHIPIVSSVYRAITGEQINPVARVTGDILYGGILGAASAVFGGVSAIADAGLESQTGKDSGGLAVAALFGPDDDKNASVQLADATPSAGDATPAASTSSPAAPATQKIELAQTANATPLLAALAVPADMPKNPSALPSSLPDAPSSNAIAPSMQAAPVAAVNPALPASPSDIPGAATPLASGISQNAAAVTATTSTANDPANIGAIQLAKTSASSKQAYGGVMAPANAQAQDMAIALAQGAPSMRMGHTIYTNKLANGSRSLPPMLSSGSARLGMPAPVVAPEPVLPAAFATPASPSAAANFGPGQSLAAGTGAASAVSSANLSSPFLQDMMMKAISQYGNLASAHSSSPGGAVNVLN